MRNIKADLAAANLEVSNVMSQNVALKKEAEEAYQNGYRDAIQALDKLTEVNQIQAGMITYFTRVLAGGLRQR